MTAVDFWCTSNGFPGTSAATAKKAEAEGWDGMLLPDSQNLTGDVYVSLALAAEATSTLKVGTGVTNPITRHPAVTASSIATIQVESRGRAVLGIGRGDSALAHLNLAPAPIGHFVHYLDRVKRYLAGEDVPFETEVDGRGQVSTAARLALSDAPAASQLRWLRYASVDGPVEVAAVASGPRVLEAVAPIVDRVVLCVGTDPGRIKWAMDIARTAASVSGREAGELQFGALVPIVVLPDRRLGEQLMASSLASAVRFSVMYGQVVGPVSPSVERALLNVHANYDMTKHVRRGTHSDFLTPEIIDAFSVVGAASECSDRIQALAAEGITRFWLCEPGTQGADPDLLESSHRALVDDVLPRLRR
jgi:5,10-methylenetetrahydromethanopterin reductase